MEPELAFQYVPLSFISTQKAIETQSLNTVVFHTIMNKYGELKSLGDLISSTQYGYTSSAKEYGKNRLLRITDINNGFVNWDTVPYCDCETTAKYELHPRDVLIARTGNNISYLVESNVPKNTVFASYLIRLSCKQEILFPEYLYSFLNSYTFWSQILKKQRGALLQNVNAKRMCELLIPYCPIEIQKSLFYKPKELHFFDISFKKKQVKKHLSCNYSLKQEITHQQDLLKKLRQQILQEAIEGKLTADWRKQNPDIEPASELLKRIQAEKVQLIKDKKLKKQKPLSPISDDEKPFALPAGWEFTSILNCSINKDEFRIPITKSDRTHRKGMYDYYGASGIIDKIDGYTHKGKHLLISEDGANLISRTTPIAFIAEGSFWVNNHAHVLATVDKITLDYLQLHINAIDLKPYITGGFQPKLSQRNLNHICIALPPLAEQQAIVARVEKLLALCDKLETQITANQTYAEQLLPAVLKEAFSNAASVQGRQKSLNKIL